MRRAWWTLLFLALFGCSSASAQVDSIGPYRIYNATGFDPGLYKEALYSWTKECLGGYHSAQDFARIQFAVSDSIFFEQGEARWEAWALWVQLKDDQRLIVFKRERVDAEDTIVHEFLHDLSDGRLGEDEVQDHRCLPSRRRAPRAPNH